MGVEKAGRKIVIVLRGEQLSFRIFKKYYLQDRHRSPMFVVISRIGFKEEPHETDTLWRMPDGRPGLGVECLRTGRLPESAPRAARDETQVAKPFILNRTGQRSQYGHPHARADRTHERRVRSENPQAAAVCRRFAGPGAEHTEARILPRYVGCIRHVAW